MNKKTFYVLTWDFNQDTIEHYDVLPYFRRRYVELVEINKENRDYYRKAPKTFDEFKKFVEDESRYNFWSRCEYEMIIHGWPVEKNEYKIDVHEQIMMNIDVITKILYDEFTN